jgi:phospholipase/carboxylesterase
MSFASFTVDPTNPHLAAAPVVGGTPLEEASLVIYAVHGRDQGPDFMVEQAERVNLPGLAWVFPRAAEHTWYPHSFLVPLSENQPALDHALSAVHTHMTDLARMGYGTQDVVLFGFSQGACLLAEFLLRQQLQLAGAFLHTGGYLGPAARSWEVVGAGLRDVSVVLVCAEEDELVPLPRVQLTAGALAGLGARIELTTYDDTHHHLNDDSIGRLRRMLRTRLLTKRDLVVRGDEDGQL